MLVLLGWQEWQVWLVPGQVAVWQEGFQQQVVLQVLVQEWLGLQGCQGLGPGLPVPTVGNAGLRGQVGNGRCLRTRALGCPGNGNPGPSDSCGACYYAVL